MSRTQKPLEIVLLGATGFVGSAMLRALSREAATVHALARRPSSLPCRLVPGDIRDVPRDLFPDRPHILVHLATKQIDSDGTGFEEMNVEATRTLIDRLPDSTQGVLYGSSVSVYGQSSQLNLDESAPLRPETPLAKSRAAAERIILEAARARGISAFCLRPRFIFGEGDRHTMPGLIRMVKRGIQPGPGSQRYTIIGVDDYARVLVELAKKMTIIQEQLPLNLGYSQSVSLDDIVRTICSAFGLEPPSVRFPVTLTATRLLRRIPSSSLQTLATRLELFGLSHTFNVSSLAARVGKELLSRDPLAALLTSATAGAR